MVTVGPLGTLLCSLLTLPELESNCYSNNTTHPLPRLLTASSTGSGSQLQLGRELLIFVYSLTSPLTFSRQNISTNFLINI